MICVVAEVKRSVTKTIVALHDHVVRISMINALSVHSILIRKTAIVRLLSGLNYESFCIIPDETSVLGRLDGEKYGFVVLCV